MLPTKIKRKIKTLFSPQKETPIHVLHIYFESPPLVNSYARITGKLLSLWHKLFPDTRIHKDFLPNNLLTYLQHKKLITCTDYVISSSQVINEKIALSFPHADIWLFSLLNYNKELAFTPEIIQNVKHIAKNNNIKTLNLTSHLSREQELPTDKFKPFPVIFKSVGNGSTRPEDTSSYKIIETQKEFQKYIKSNNTSSFVENYTIEPFHNHLLRKNLGGFFLIERWIYICGDITVGIRFSANPIIKQYNSRTFYKRDPKQIAEDNTFLSSTETFSLIKGSQPLPFNYSDSSAFWDKRKKLLDSFTQKSNIDIASFDVIEDKDGILHILDYNEHTWESAHGELFQLWAKALFDKISSKA